MLSPKASREETADAEGALSASSSWQWSEISACTYFPRVAQAAEEERPTACCSFATA